MKLPLIIAVIALAMSFALAGCSSTAKKPAPTPQTEKPAASVKDLSEPGDADPEEHRATVVSRAEEFRRCYSPALKAQPGLRGEVTLRWDVNGAGDVVKEEVVRENTTIGNQAMIECMLDRVHNWKFDTGPKDQVSTVTYPFYFSPPTR